jgi:hypothetical protein
MLGLKKKKIKINFTLHALGGRRFYGFFKGLFFFNFIRIKGVIGRKEGRPKHAGEWGAGSIPGEGSL